MQFLSFALLAIPPLVAVVAADKSHFLTEDCARDWKIINEYTLVTSCQQHVCDDASSFTGLNLDHCIGNTNGKLHGAKNGLFSQRCYNCHQNEDDYKLLTCTCHNDTQAMNIVSIDLTDETVDIHNWFGNLQCFNQTDASFKIDYRCKNKHEFKDGEKKWQPAAGQDDGYCKDGCPERDGTTTTTVTVTSAQSPSPTGTGTTSPASSSSQSTTIISLTSSMASSPTKATSSSSTPSSSNTASMSSSTQPTSSTGTLGSSSQSKSSVTPTTTAAATTKTSDRRVRHLRA
ncbi:hypothetical protein GGR57DRAFT_512572 [Xylariaceae sp. FL1272]|nr:hypothetical protein GGR57DRAFT_512572 [Xylariaceae sp. FL1272]